MTDTSFSWLVMILVTLVILIVATWAIHTQTTQQFYASQGSTGPGTIMR